MRLYRALLYFYPASFRSEYGREMCAVFQRRLRDASGCAALMSVWVSVFLETLGNAAALHGDILRQDLRVSLRAVRRAPGFAFTAVIVLALGIGVNTAAFSVTDHVLIRPLPFREPARLVKLYEDLPGYPRMELSPSNYRDWKRMSTSFEGMAAIRGNSAVFLGEPAPERIEGASVTADLFPLLGVQAAFGRLFTPDDDRESASGTLLLSQQLWQTRFGGDRSVVGRTIHLDSGVYTVIGVMPEGFHYPNREVQFWMPMRFAASDFQDRANNFLQVLARVRPGISLAAARAEMRLIASRLEREYPKENQHTGATVVGLRDEISMQSRLLLWALSGASACILFIACANLANLQLGRALMRQRELAVRTALGAGRERLARQLLTESLLLTAGGAVLGVFLGMLALPLLARLVPDLLPISALPPLDLRVLTMAAALSTLTGIGIGVIPALSVSRSTDLTALRDGPRSGGGRRQAARSALVVAEVAATMVLLSGSGLFLRALWNLRAVHPGFRPDGVLTLRTALAMPKYEKTATRTGFYTRVLSDIRALPTVSGAAYVSFFTDARSGRVMAGFRRRTCASGAGRR